MLKSDIEQAYLDLVPCSVQKIVVVSGYYPKLSRPSVNQRKLAFKDWVAYDLYGGSATHNRDHIECPLIGCATRFDNLESCLFHLTKCAWLDNAWYWCPFCTRPERFTDPESSSVSPVKSEPSPTASEPASSSDQKGSKSGSAAARLLKNIGSRLGFATQNPAVGPCTNMNIVDQGTGRPPRRKIMKSLAAVMHPSASQQPGGYELEGYSEHGELQWYMRSRPAERPSLDPFAPNVEVHPYTQAHPEELPGRDPSQPEVEVHTLTQIRSEPSTQCEAPIPMHAALDGPPFMGMSCYNLQDSYHEAQHQHPSDYALQDSYHEVPYQDLSDYVLQDSHNKVPYQDLSDYVLQDSHNKVPHQHPSDYVFQDSYREVPYQHPSDHVLQDSYHEVPYQDLSDYTLQDSHNEAPHQHLPRSLSDLDANVYQKPASGEVQLVYSQSSTCPNHAPDKESSWKRFLSEPEPQILHQPKRSDRFNLDNFPTNADPQAPIHRDTSPCPMCDHTFSGKDRRSNRNRHIKYDHGNLGKFQCPTEGCNKKYSRPDNLLKHLRIKHVDAQLRASQRTAIEMQERT